MAMEPEHSIVLLVLAFSISLAYMFVILPLAFSYLTMVCKPTDTQKHGKMLGCDYLVTVIGY